MENHLGSKEMGHLSQYSYWYDLLGSIFFSVNICHYTTVTGNSVRSRWQCVYLECKLFSIVFVETLQHSAIYPHPEHLTCYTVIVCNDIPFDLQRFVVEGFEKTLRERSRVQIWLLLDRDSRLVRIRHVNYRQHMSEEWWQSNRCVSRPLTASGS